MNAVGKFPAIEDQLTCTAKRTIPVEIDPAVELRTARGGALDIDRDQRVQFPNTNIGEGDAAIQQTTSAQGWTRITSDRGLWVRRVGCVAGEREKAA